MTRSQPRNHSDTRELTERELTEITGGDGGPIVHHFHPPLVICPIAPARDLL